MKNCDQLVHAKWIITAESNQQPLENHALAIQNGKILEILPSSKARLEYSAKSQSEYNSHAIMPGFVNTHTHLPMNWFRGFADDLALMNWLNNYIWPAERQWVSYEFVKDASLFAMAEMIRGGTTCFNDMYFFPEPMGEATAIAHMRGHISIHIIDFPTAWGTGPDDYFAKGLEFLDQYKNNEYVTVTMAPHAIYTVSEKYLLRAKEIAEKNNLQINMHIQETADEVNQSIAQTGLRPLKRLQNIGLVSPRLIAVHMTQLNDEDYEIIQTQKPNIVHCPESNMKLASGTCQVEKLRKMGINVALGTDGAASNNDLDMIGEMRTAALLAKLATSNPEALKAYEAIQMATINGARALGIDKITGSLLAGKSADFIAVDLSEIETQPLYHPESQIVYAASRNQVTDVWIMGKQVMKNRVLLTLDEKALKEKAKLWKEKISGHQDVLSSTS